MADNDVRYGIVGAGMMGVEHIQNLNAIDGAVVTAIADPHEASQAQAQAAAEGPIEVFTDHRALVDAGVCDALVIASPNYQHADQVLELLETDLHLLVEKPLCTTVGDTERLIAAADGRAAKVAVGMEYRYMAPVARLIQTVRSGGVGTTHMVAIREHRFPFLTKVDDWNRFTRNTGGTLVEKCCHFFDLMNLILDERPTRVYASGAQSVNHLDEVYDGETPDILDNAYVTVDYPSGARAMLDLCMFAEATLHQEEVVAVGDKGKVEALLPASEYRHGRRGVHWVGGVPTEIVHDERIAHEGLHHGSSYLEHLDFLAAVRGERDVEVSLADGAWAVAVGAAAHRSIDEGRAVEMSEMFSTEGAPA